MDVKAELIAFEQIREHEEAEMVARPINAIAKATSRK